MRKHLLLALVSTVLLLPSGAMAQKRAYGYTMQPASHPSLISFSIDDVANVTPMGSYTKADPRSGAAVKGKLYMMGIDDDFNTWFYYMDLTTGESETIKKLGDISIPADMTYDYTTETMYSIANSETVDGVSALSTVNLENGSVTTIIDDLGYSCKAIAVDARGQLYALNNQAQLLKVNKSSGESQLMGSTGLNLAKWWNFQSMEFDREDGTLYLAAWTADEQTMLYSIDTTTGRATLVGTIGDGTHTIALTIPYEPADGQAPDRVTDVKLTADANGELKATLSWTNPFNDYSGRELESALNIEVTDETSGEKTVLEDCHPGEAMEMEITVDQAGMYTYTIVAANEAGASLEQTVEGWIGHDVPAAVSQATAQLSRTSLMVNDLKWSAPTMGAHGGYMDKKSLRYDIVRVNDGKTVASDLAVTRFSDVKLLDDLTRYSYRIIAKNEDGTGETAVTNDLVNGPAVECPLVAPFNTWEESGQYWTVLDGNGDEYPFVWYNDYMNMFGLGYNKGFYIYQKSDVYYANDFIISPPIKFTEGHDYKITASVSNDDIAGYREESFRFYNMSGYDLNGAIPLGNEAFTVKHPGEFRDYSFTFKVEDDGVGRSDEDIVSFIALCCTSRYDMGMLLVSSITVEDITATPEPLVGDVNGDGTVNISDVNALIGYILADQSSANGDMNGDGTVNISDVNALIGIILAN